MKEIVIAFDIDGTLLNNEGIPPETPSHLRPRCGVNINAVMLMQLLSKQKNTKIIVWSGGGRDYAEKICREYGFDKYVHRAYGKPQGTHGLANIHGSYDYETDGPVDIAFDDIHACVLADKNIIVKMK